MFHRFNIGFLIFYFFFSSLLTGTKVCRPSVWQQTAHVANPWFCLLALWVLGRITMICPCLEDSFHSRAACKFPEICFCFVLFWTNIYLLRFCWTRWGFLKDWFSGSLKDKIWQRIWKNLCPTTFHSPLSLTCHALRVRSLLPGSSLVFPYLGVECYQGVADFVWTDTERGWGESEGKKELTDLLPPHPPKTLWYWASFAIGSTCGFHWLKGDADGSPKLFPPSFHPLQEEAIQSLLLHLLTWQHSPFVVNFFKILV